MASVAKRRWEKPDGSLGEKWIVRFIDASGSHRQKTFDRKKEADAFRLQVAHEKMSHGSVLSAAASTTIGQLCSEYGRHVDRRFADGQIKRGSHRNIIDALRVSVLPRLSHVKLIDITPVVIERWFMDLRSKDGLSARTAVHRLSKLSGMLDFAEGREMIRVNPAKKARANIGGIPDRPIRLFAIDEVQQLLAASAVRRKNQHGQTQRMVQVMVHLAVFCGMRLGEILALEIGKIDLVARTIRVDKSLDQWDDADTPKTLASYRVLRMPQQVVDLLTAWIEQDYRPNPRSMVFRRNIPGRGVTDGAVSGRHFGSIYFWRLCDGVGLGPDKEGRRFHFHALRHFAGSWWLKKGLPITTVARLMGHASPAVTMKIYAHDLMAAEAQQSALEQIAADLTCA